MNKSFGIILSLLLSACTSLSSKPMRARSLASSACSKELTACSPLEPKVNYLCMSQTSSLMVQDKSRCLAENKLKELACNNKQDISDIKCIEDQTNGECPLEASFCTFQYQPSICRIETYDGKSLSWDAMPTAWASNPCQGKIKLKEKLCFNGLVPSKIGVMECRPDASKNKCPPQNTCNPDLNDPLTCSVDSFNSKPLEQKWTVFAKSKCEARYQLELLACKFDQGASEEPSKLLGKLVCLSGTKPQTKSK